jgi:hypothetical protein
MGDLLVEEIHREVVKSCNDIAAHRGGREKK